MEDHQIEHQPFLITVGDWVCGEGGYGQVTQIYHEYYEEYSDFTAWNAGGKNVGDYKETWAILKYFCTEKKVRHNTTGYTRIRPSTSPIVEGDTRGWWDLIQKFIKENPKEYLAYQEYKPQMLEDHIHVGYFVGPRLGNSKHTKEYFIDLIAKIRKNLPERFTFPELMEVAEKYQCPFRLDKPVPHGYIPNMYITLFYNQGECRGKRKLFCGLDRYVDFGHFFYEASDYQEKIAADFKEENYQSVIDVLKRNIENDIDPLVSTVELIYVHWYIALEVREFPCCGMTWEECCAELKRVYITYSPPWMDNADFLFYVAYMGSCFCEAFIGLGTEERDDMFIKAYRMHPDNLLYQWGELCTREPSYKEEEEKREWRVENRRMARLILADEECVKSIRKYPLLGDDLLWLLDINRKEEEE